ncbi:MAG: hypothetical protein KME30_09865 [Iphinoe sp. HA4291-MV1]|nr:hypothetical protein [Iphinoe sp. HA4291-MV1]
MIINSGNDYIAALKGNQPGLLKDVKTNFTPEFTYEQINKGHGRVEKRHVSICQNLDGIRPWPGLTTLIPVKSERRGKNLPRKCQPFTGTRCALHD